MQDNSPPPRLQRRYAWRFRRYTPPSPPDLQEESYDPLLEDGGVQPEEYTPTAEDFIPSPPKPVGPLDRYPRSQSMRVALLALVLFFVASIPHWRDSAAGGWVSREAVFEGHEYWRLLTALFTHSDFGHLLSNTPLFLIFGWYLRDFFGLLAFPVAALLTGVLSNLATIWFYPASTQLVGASGMLYGMVALWLVLYVRFELNYSVPMRIFRAIGVSLVLLFPTTFQETTSYLAHATGFFIGLLVGMLLSFVVKVRP